MTSFKRFRKIDYSYGYFISLMMHGHPEIRGRGFPVCDHHGNLNGFGNASASERQEALDEPRMLREPTAKEREQIRVAGPSRFHREV